MTEIVGPLIYFNPGEERRAEVRRRLEAAGLDVIGAARMAGLPVGDYLDAAGNLIPWPQLHQQLTELAAALARVALAGVAGFRGAQVTIDGQPVGVTSIVVSERVRAAAAPVAVLGTSAPASPNRRARRIAAAQKRSRR